MTASTNSGNRPGSRHRWAVALVVAALLGTLCGGRVAVAAPAQAPQVAPAPSLPPTADTSQRTVPGIANSTGFRVRPQPGSGTYQYVAPIPLPARAVPFFGDWDGDGAATPGYFLDGIWTIYRSYVGVPAPSATFTFGAKGDRPVVGDWNGDGRTGIGIVRNGYWLQRNTAGPGAPDSFFRYGRLPGDRPLTGDWNGDGVDTPGVQRSASFLLNDRNQASSPTRELAYGRADDAAVSGDWNGDGIDTVGLVRSRQTWYLLDANRSGSSRQQRTIAIGAGTPAPFAGPVGAAGTSCPTASAIPQPRVQPQVVAPEAARLGRSMATESPALRAALTDSLRSLLGPVRLQTVAARTHHPYLNLLADSANREIAVRPSTMTAVTLGIALAMDGYDPTTVGRSRTEALAELDWLLRSAACQHRSVSPGGWGHDSQSILWASTSAYGAWLVWNELSPETRRVVATMLQDEANYWARRPVEYWADRDGNINPGRTGNSAAEEMAWDAGGLAVALQMMPGDAGAPVWLHKATQMATASYASQEDTTSTAVVNGIALRDRLEGYNTTPEGAVVNHGGLSADYTTVARQAWWAVMYGAVGGRPVPEAFVLNRRRVWTALTQVDWPDTGVIYQPDGTISYPDVASWGQHRYPTYASTDAIAHLVGADIDPVTGRRDATPALMWQDRHVGRVRALQVRHPDGRMYAPGEERYPAPEPFGAHLVAYTWAARYADRNLPPATISSEVVPLPGE